MNKYRVTVKLVQPDNATGTYVIDAERHTTDEHNNLLLVGPPSGVVAIFNAMDWMAVEVIDPKPSLASLEEAAAFFNIHSKGGEE